jgi:hypothetical protein
VVMDEIHTQIEIEEAKHATQNITMHHYGPYQHTPLNYKRVLNCCDESSRLQRAENMRHLIGSISRIIRRNRFKIASSGHIAKRLHF